MRKKQQPDELGCPDVIPPTKDYDDKLCSPDYCPERLQTPKYTSPTTCLPWEKQRELEEKINAANQLLLDLALSNEQPDASRRDALEKLIGIKIKIKLTNLIEDQETPKKKSTKRIYRKYIRRKKPKNQSVYRKRRQKKHFKKRKVDYLIGNVSLVGFNFVSLQANHGEYLIPFEKINTIQTQQEYLTLKKEPHFSNIDPCFRRDLTFHFGETVASSPELIQVFYKIRLDIYLLLLIHHQVKITTNEGSFNGIIVGVYKDSLSLCMKKQKVRDIPFRSIVYMSF